MYHDLYFTASLRYFAGTRITLATNPACHEEFLNGLFQLICIFMQIKHTFAAADLLKMSENAVRLNLFKNKGKDANVSVFLP